MTETITRRLPTTVPLALVAVVGWLLLEIVARLGSGVAGAVALGPVVGDTTDATIVGSFFALLFGLPVAALLLSRYALRAGQSRADWDYDWAPRTVAVGLAAGLVGLGVTWAIAHVDAALFGANEAATAALTGAIEATPWAVPVLLVGNGVVGPAAEERVWRGVAQTDLVDRWGVVAGIVVTAVLFSLKHAVVDASLGRLFTIIALGLIWGAVRHR
jgi:membrane protease YdiL (CAAX protease family)